MSSDPSTPAAPGHDSHGHDSHGHDDAHDAHGAHAPAPPAPAPEPEPIPVNPETKHAELLLLQAAFHVATRSLFTYFSEPGSVLAFTPDDRRLKDEFDRNVDEDGEQADHLAALVRERGTEPTARAFPEKFTRLNYITYTSAAEHLREDLASHKEVLDQLLTRLPAAATPTTRDALEKFRDERARHLAFWSAEARKAADDAAAKLAARKAAAAAKPVAKH